MKILNKLGLHARAAAKVVSVANEYKSNITLKKDKKNADAKSIMKILMLSASKGSSIEIIIDGNHSTTIAMREKLLIQESLNFIPVWWL